MLDGKLELIHTAPSEGTSISAIIRVECVKLGEMELEENIEHDLKLLEGKCILIVDDIKWNFKVLQNKLIKIQPVRVVWSKTVVEMWG